MQFYVDSSLKSMPNSEEKIGNALPGSCNDDAVIRGILTQAIKQADLSRERVAEQMSHLLAREITAQMLNDFTADSKKQHRFPLAWLRAFCTVTGDWRLLQHIADQAGLAVIAAEDRDVLALGELVVERAHTGHEIERHTNNILQRRNSQ